MTNRIVIRGFYIHRFTWRVSQTMFDNLRLIVIATQNRAWDKYGYEFPINQATSFNIISAFNQVHIGI